MRVKLNKVGHSNDDNFRTDAEYILIPIDRPILNRPMWFRSITDHRVLFHTEPLTKVGFGFLKSRRCKYIIQTLEE